ncbi:aminopeptidase [Sporolactobacillus sp. THM7-7]|nr:aminopeptidase [Sporolactobacillus sp. THM7-7]
MSQELIGTCRSLLIKCLNLKAGETFLVVTDDVKKDMADSLYEAGQDIGAEAMLLLMKKRKKSGEEPPSAIAAALKQADAAVCITECSMSHTKARKNAAAQGTRIATMPGITRDMFLEGAITADYQEVEELTKRVTNLLSRGESVTIEKEGYRFSFSIDGRKGVPSTGVYIHPGDSGNLPSGEAYIAPVEGTANGQLFIDGSAVGIGKLSSNMILTVEEGKLVQAVGDDADTFLSLLGNGTGRLVGEFGIGTNKSARITGNVLEDEKVYGTAHVAFGSNLTFGGTIEAGVHLDGVFKEPTIYIDDRLVMENGKLTIF